MMENEEFYEDTSKEKLRKIRNNETGEPMKILSIIYIILAVLMLIFGLILGISSEAIDTMIAFTFLGILLAATLFLIAVGLKMFYEIHFVITHLNDVFNDKK